MEGTEFSEIYHMFLNSIQDYHLKNLFNEDINLAEDMLESFLIKAVSNFYNCTKVKDIDLLQKKFCSSLNIDEKNIVANLMTLAWLEYNINDIVQMELNLNDGDFKHFAEEKNLEKKLAYANNLRETITQSMTNYGLYQTDFKEWAVGNYGL